MATQIAATPIVRGEVANKIFAEANTKRSSAAKSGAKKLINKFKGKVKK